MRYINIITKEYPRHLGDLQLIYGAITEDEIPEEWAAAEIESEPEITIDQYLEIEEPKLIDGQWRQGWIIKDMTSEQKRLRDEIVQKLPLPGQVRPVESL